ncbi:MAG: family 10 glycosylhydrolase [Myxococcota bacterium]
MRTLWLLLVGCAGAGAAVGTDANVVDAGAPDAALPDGATDEDAAVAETTAAVSHRREFRGTWIATVSRINWPTARDATAQQAELRSILDAAEQAGLNAVFFQVRPEADALYRSTLEPWSRYLTGTQGEDPGYDPLSFAIDEAHARGLELHAWLNPYRARAGSGATAATHVSQTMPDAVIRYGSLLWLDPGDPRAFDHTVAVVRDLTERYDLDGIHFDDYFYPYPQDGAVFDDDATYRAYGDGMSRADWRRDNVNRMVARVSEVVAETRADVRWGISPFGIYRPGMPEGVVGLDQYATLYADPLAWMDNGWVDYLAPQLYWPTTSTGQRYEDLTRWWAARADSSGRHLLIGNAASRGFGLDEYRAEMEILRAHRDGAVWWSVGPLVENEDGLRDMLRGEYYDRPAATPPLVGASGVPNIPVVEDGQVVSSAEGVRYWAVYAEVDGRWELRELVPSAETRLPLEGRSAVSAIGRNGLESLGTLTDGVVHVDPDPPRASCVHSFGGDYRDRACSPSYQCCDGAWLARGTCGECACEEATGREGC